MLFFTGLPFSSWHVILLFTAYFVEDLDLGEPSDTTLLLLLLLHPRCLCNSAYMITFRGRSGLLADKDAQPNVSENTARAI